MPSLIEMFNPLNLLVIMKLNWRDLTVLFPHSQHGDQRRGSATSASGDHSRSACLGVLMMVGVFCSAGAFAQTTLQQQIDTAVEQHLQQRLKKEAASEGWKGVRFTQTSIPQTIASLAPCDQAIAVKDEGENRNWSRQRFSLQCGAGGWKLAVNTEVKVYVSAVVAKQVINRGETFHSGQLALQEIEVTKLNSGFYSSLDKVIGQGAKRRIRADQLLSPNLVASALVIQRGQQVTISANHDGINASTQGEALENGAVGDVIRIRNLSSKKTVEAKVLEAGVVTTTF